MQLIPAYLPSLHYMATLMREADSQFSLLSHYQKQTYRNRCKIYGANGVLNLSIPIHHTQTNGHQKDGDVAIKWEENWQTQHWKSITSAYRSSPYFEFYEDEFKSAFFEKPISLMEYNLGLLKLLTTWLSIEMPKKYTKSYEALTEEEMQLINAKKKTEIAFPPYTQVFANKHGFLSNLSCIDLIFNLGPESKIYLNQWLANPTPLS